VRCVGRFSLRAVLAAAGVVLVATLPVVPRPPQAAAADPAPAPATTAAPGYWLAGSDGSAYRFGAAADLGRLPGPTPAHPVTGLASTPTGAGYWMVGADGGIFSFGDARFFGSTGAIRLNQPIVGMAATPTGQGYWFVAADGGIFSFGDAAFYGSTGAMKLNKPIVGMAATQSGKGYWFVAADGGIFSFGDAAFYGSTGAIKLRSPIAGMASSSSGAGYWFVAADGGIFNFGDAPFLGSAGGTKLPAGVVAMAAARGGPPAGTNGGDTPSTTGLPTTATTATATPPGAPFQIGLIGDTGYTPAQDTVLDQVIAQMNTDPLAFVVHDGDIKDPLTPCTDERYETVKAQFNNSVAPFVYAVGDNEWMDCDNTGANPNQSPMDAAGRLDELRELFFHEDTSLGVSRLPLTDQRQAGYPENTRWTMGGVVFATLNAPGPTDNLFDKSESGPRRVANQAWLQAAFDEAQATNAPAVMIIWQADPWQPIFGVNDTPGYWGYLTDELKQRAAAFGKPVVLVHGDTHICRMDQPWPDVPNFTRLETHGTTDTGNWIRATVDPSAPGVFRLTTVAANPDMSRKHQQEPSCPPVG
jgi:ribosomal protein L24E